MRSCPSHAIICESAAQRLLEVVERARAVAQTKMDERQVEWQHRAIGVTSS